MLRVLRRRTDKKELDLALCATAAREELTRTDYARRLRYDSVDLGANLAFVSHPSTIPAKMLM
jgi:hypothetical protein